MVTCPVDLGSDARGDLAGVGVDGARCDLGGIPGAAVGEGGIGDRLFDGSDDGPSLAERHLQVVPCAPTIVGIILGILLVLLLHHRLGVDTGVMGLTGQVDAGHFSIPVAVGGVLDGRRAVGDARVRLVVVPEPGAQVVEEDVARHRQGLGHVDPPGRLAFVVVVRRAP